MVGTGFVVPLHEPPFIEAEPYSSGWLPRVVDNETIFKWTKDMQFAVELRE